MDHLLQEVLDLINTFLRRKEQIKEETRSSKKGKTIRDNIAQNIQKSKEEIGEPSSNLSFYDKECEVDISTNTIEDNAIEFIFGKFF